jgi:4-amino-4-deoxy-L-arabinose transferase-like glycosyltransferase
VLPDNTRETATPAPVRTRWIPAGDWALLLTVLLLGLALFVWQLGATGLVDETPPLFAAAARAMAETGDWLTPRVNGLPRYDKPPLVYWLMGLGYLLPGQPHWNPLGTWAARLPSALGSTAVMLLMASTLLRWPQPGRPRRLLALAAPLAFALSPLVLLWSRIAVSDALFSALVAATLLLFWRCYAAAGQRWWQGWLLLGLAVLAKGPVAVVLAALTLALFAWRQAAVRRLCCCLRPWPGLLLTALVAVPWYGLMLLVEGRPYWDSFFGYHNLQRFSGVVNNHLQPWWFFLPVLVVASLPFTPLLLAGLLQALRRPGTGLPGDGDREGGLAAAQSLPQFAACWLLAVLLFFTLAATKLPSYWIPATPAAGLLIAWAALDPALLRGRGGGAWRASVLALLALFSLGLAAAPRWIPLINDPELPTLPAELLASGAVLRAAACFGLALLLAVVLGWGSSRWRPLWLLGPQLALVLFVLTAHLPMVALGDRVRQLPVRAVAADVVVQRRPGEPLAMVGILKPSLHYYARQVVLFEGVQPNGPINLSDRLAHEHRRGLQPAPGSASPSLLLVIDQGTAVLPHWRATAHQLLARHGLYALWRVQRSDLDRQAASLRAAGVPAPDWQRPRPERY